MEPWSDLPERFEAGSEMLLLLAGEPARPVTVERSRRHGRHRLVRLSGVEDRDGAVAVVGALLAVERERSPELPPGRYYQWQLVGCRCLDRRAGHLGRVTDVVEDGGGLLLVVEGSAGDQLLVPFVDAFLVSVDVAAELIELELPEGFLEACASPSSRSSPNSSRPS